MVPMALSLPRTQATDLPGRAVTMDEAAFRHLYQRTARPLWAYLLRSCGDLALADDLLQEAYLRMLRSGFEGEDDDRRRNYLFRIATNLLRDHFRVAFNSELNAVSDSKVPSKVSDPVSEQLQIGEIRGAAANEDRCYFLPLEIRILGSQFREDRFGLLVLELPHQTHAPVIGGYGAGVKPEFFRGLRAPVSLGFLSRT